MLTSFNNISIKGIVCAVPKEVVRLRELECIFGRNEVDKIIGTTGIERLRIADKDRTASDYGIEAASCLFDRTKISPQSVNGVIFVSQTPDYITPATSKILQHKLQLPSDALAVDVNEGCNGFMVGLYLAHSFLSLHTYRRILVVVGDTLSKFVNEHDRSLRMVLGDGTSAVLIEKEEDFPMSVFELKNDGSRYDKLIIPAGGSRHPYQEEKARGLEHDGGDRCGSYDLRMDGIEIMNFCLREVPKTVESVLMASNRTLSDIDVFIFHQANEFIVGYIRKILKIEKDKVPIVVNEYGNTSGCSIPIVIASRYEEFKIQKKLRNVLLSGFGVGLSWGASVLSLEGLEYADVIEA